MSECTRCGNDVVYPHIVQSGRLWSRVCDECYGDVCEEHARDLAEKEYELEVTV
jgi:hypothetical protein